MKNEIMRGQRPATHAATHYLVAVVLVTCCLPNHARVIGGSVSSDDPPLIKLKAIHPDSNSPLIAGTEATCELRIETVAGRDVVVPKRYSFIFEEASNKKAQAGYFTGEVKPVRGNLYECMVKVKLPKRPGTYTLRMQPVPIRSLAMTLEEKIGITTMVTVMKP